MLRRNGPGRSRPAWMLAVWMLLMAGPGRGQADEPPTRGPKAAVTPPAPALPSEVVLAMQSGRYDDAIRAIEPLTAAAKSADDRAYFGLIRATAERLAGRGDAARATAAAALEAAPNGAWAAKLRFGTRRRRGGRRQVRRRRGPGPRRGRGPIGRPPARIDWPRCTSRSPAAF